MFAYLRRILGKAEVKATPDPWDLPEVPASTFEVYATPVATFLRNGVRTTEWARCVQCNDLFIRSLGEHWVTTCGPCMTTAEVDIPWDELGGEA